MGVRGGCIFCGLQYGHTIVCPEFRKSSALIDTPCTTSDNSITNLKSSEKTLEKYEKIRRLLAFDSDLLDAFESLVPDSRRIGHEIEDGRPVR